MAVGCILGEGDGGATAAATTGEGMTGFKVSGEGGNIVSPLVVVAKDDKGATAADDAEDGDADADDGCCCWETTVAI